MVLAGVGDEVGDVFSGVQGSSGPSSQPRGGEGGSENAGAAPRPRRGLREAEALSSAAPGPPQLALPKRSPRGRAAQDPLPWDVSAPPPSSRDSQGTQSRSSACAAPTWPPRTPAHSGTARHLDRSCLPQNILGPGTASNALTPQGRGTKLLRSRRSVEHLWIRLQLPEPESMPLTTWALSRDGTTEMHQRPV